MSRSRCQAYSCALVSAAAIGCGDGEPAGTACEADVVEGQGVFLAISTEPGAVASTTFRVTLGVRERALMRRWRCADE